MFWGNLNFRECTAALIPIIDSKKPSFSSKIKGFTIGNPIGNPWIFRIFRNLPKFQILESLRIEFIPVVLSEIRYGIHCYTHKRLIRESKSVRNTFRGAGRAC